MAFNVRYALTLLLLHCKDALIKLSKKKQFDRRKRDNLSEFMNETKSCHIKEN